jgi:hypothetical protein
MYWPNDYVWVGVKDLRFLGTLTLLTRGTLIHPRAFIGIGGEPKNTGRILRISTLLPAATPTIVIGMIRVGKRGNLI